MESIINDLRYSVRRLLKSPGFTIPTVLTLAIGIGANTAIFSSMDAVVLRPLAVPALDRVVTVSEQHGSAYEQAALANYTDWKRETQAFEDLSVRANASMSLTGAGDATHVQVALTSEDFFRVLRVKPLFGRLFSSAECAPGQDGVAVLNYAFWQGHFAGDHSVLGREIKIDQRPYTIIGVMPKSAQYPSRTDVFVPFAPTAAQLANRRAHEFFVLGRLRDGVSLKQAQLQMRVVADRLASIYPDTNLGWSIAVEPLLAGINGKLTPLYYSMVMGATLFVLLVVCANVANLQLARGLSRRREIAIRSSLGASRWRLMRQLLTENIVLALLGATGGILFGSIYLHLTVITMPEQVARSMAGWSNISLNGRALAFSLLLGVGSGIVVGLMPALEAFRVTLAGQLKAGSRSTTSRGRVMTKVFAVAQISLAVALVSGAGLMARGMWSMLHVADLHQPEKMLTFDVALPATRYNSPQKRSAWYAESLEILRSLPGVTDAEVTTAMPYSDYAWAQEFAIQNRPAPPGKQQNALRLPVSAGYFAALHIPVVAGRGFSSSDSLDSPPVAVVSRKFAEQYFPGENPLGRRIRMGPEQEPWMAIVGIAEEARYSMWDEAVHPAVYMPAIQMPPQSATFAVMGAGDARALAGPARKSIAKLDPALPLKSVETYARSIRESLTGLIYAAVLLAVDGLIALLLAAIGIFGVMANLVGERTREIGVRLAIGATGRDILAMIMRRASWMIGIGVAIGLLIAFWLASLMANLLRGVSVKDVAIFAAVAIAIAGSALIASWIPARRASQIEAVTALRDE